MTDDNNYLTMNRRSIALDHALSLAKVGYIPAEELVAYTLGAARAFLDFLENPDSNSGQASASVEPDPDEWVYFCYENSFTDKDGYPTTLYRTRRKDCGTERDSVTDARYSSAPDNIDQSVVVEYNFLSGRWGNDMAVYAGPVPPEFLTPEDSPEYDYWTDGDGSDDEWVYRSQPDSDLVEYNRAYDMGWLKSWSTREELDREARNPDSSFAKIRRVTDVPAWARD